MLFVQLILAFMAMFSNNENEPISTKNQNLAGYFTFPIAPGSQASLSGTFGDIRINHFHSGLDIRTGGREGKSVFAAADGYVSRINISRGGYGNALYITHPNGLTTLYAHLQDFSPKIKEYLLGQQYARQEWEVDITLDPSALVIKKSEMVALSGNTGGSGGPHLHFEVRDSKENTLDPSLFEFYEIKDNVAPVIEMISVVCKSSDARINGEFGAFDYPVIRLKDGTYKLTKTLDIQGKVGFEIYTYDKSQTSPFRLGIKTIEAKVNGFQTYLYDLTKLSFHNKLDMNIHTNYERMLNDSKKFHKAYYEDGNTLNLYRFANDNGLMSFPSNETSIASFEISDALGNKTVLIADITNTGNSDYDKVFSTTGYSKIHDHFLQILANKNDEITIETIAGIKSMNYNGRIVLDLRNERNLTVKINGNPIKIPFTTLMGPNNPYYSNADFELNLGSMAYQDVPLTLEKNGNTLHLHEDVVPLKGKINATWKNIESLNEHTHVYIDGRNPKFVGGVFSGNSVFFEPKEYGTYVLLEDREQPYIKVRETSGNKLVFYISDKLSGIKDIKCFVNGEWVLMEYEYKNGSIWSEKLDNSKPFSGNLDLYVTDNANNQAHYTATI